MGGGETCLLPISRCRVNDDNDENDMMGVELGAGPSRIKYIKSEWLKNLSMHMTYHICNFDRIPNTLKGPTKPNQTKPASPSTSNPSWLSVAKSRLVCTVFVWSLLGLWSEEIIHLPLNPKPPKSDATARELNSERFLGSFVVLVGGTVPRGQRGFGGEGGEGGGEATYPMFMFLFGLGCGNCDYYPEQRLAAEEQAGCSHPWTGYGAGNEGGELWAAASAAGIHQPVRGIRYTDLYMNGDDRLYCADDGRAYHMIPPRPALPRPTDRLGIGDEMPRQAPRSPPRPDSYLGGWSGIGNVADYLRLRWKRVHFPAWYIYCILLYVQPMSPLGCGRAPSPATPPPSSGRPGRGWFLAAAQPVPALRRAFSRPGPSWVRWASAGQCPAHSARCFRSPRLRHPR
ncbi:predicted protein [Histoplasma capsulatum G186AR]|uniref:Uncharacterized protein n=1 Tax=Ajellomyces capsulatus (strain G186AR / H82 / ATCC MYA-2454 / RMSCC 2432) TaxID=447093 RepID=C0NDD1_AJECG|nr:uncharacterized protein HCBG_01127 [Histoplasma capsulatum G186AR]EEH11672.1 predicted protein [Histoplasma capsulatum G186AR]